ncbi:uncharacterized protein LOC143027958 [Oratosquilla oratoria]|uniref:uncharacterized protein LOC143027958 n=1 Tax=Oratosquilla oratoria TaxID=337810 RepID=UPI003F75FD9F
MAEVYMAVIVGTGTPVINGITIVSALGVFCSSFSKKIPAHGHAEAEDSTVFFDITRTNTLKTSLSNVKRTELLKADYEYWSSTEFLDCVNSVPAEGEMTFLDAESLFICVPESAFRCPRGNLYQERDGVSMGSPFDVLFTNFFMGSVQKKVFSRTQQPMAYGRYVDDTFVRTQTSKEREGLHQLLQEISGFRFTTGKGDNDTLTLLDVLLTQDGDRMNTKVYIKPTNPGLCLSGGSECPRRYKDSTIASFYRIVLTQCSSWTFTQKEFDRATQMLVNNGHSN